MRELLLDGANWFKPDDFYDSVFAAVGAPPWHGRNFNALIDSISTGGINAIEVPYRIVIFNAHLIGPDAQETASRFTTIIERLQEDRECPVQIEVRPRLETHRK
ncbi:barstar family protein [Terriglobus roseus]|uniref:barstar family protein n=1 Tax=Terriglobus roseus TaxID=392734 RepID=UPI00155F822F|nr:barstar family protein [Terriglobus roseus]